MSSNLFEIIYEDADLLAINKPAGLVCHPTKTDALSSLIGRVRLYLGETARPHLVNRLDRETSGVTMVAKTDPAARSITVVQTRVAVAVGTAARSSPSPASASRIRSPVEPPSTVRARPRGPRPACTARRWMARAALMTFPEAHQVAALGGNIDAEQIGNDGSDRCASRSGSS